MSPCSFQSEFHVYTHLPTSLSDLPLAASFHRAVEPFYGIPVFRWVYFSVVITSRAPRTSACKPRCLIVSPVNVLGNVPVKNRRPVSCCFSSCCISVVFLFVFLFVLRAYCITISGHDHCNTSVGIYSAKNPSRGSNVTSMHWRVGSSGSGWGLTAGDCPPGVRQSSK